MPFFSVVIPSYNRADMICQTVQAFLKQSFTDFELIVVDDGSTDNTAAVIATIQDNRVRYLSQTNKERGAARNYGAQQATGIYLNFFDSDDTPFVNHLQNAYDFIQANNKPEWFHVGYKTVDEKGNVVSAETNFNYDVSQRLIVTNFLGCNSVFLRRDVFLDNPFHEDRRLASSEDWEIWLRWISRYPLPSCDTVTFQMNNHAGRSLFTIKPERIVERDTLLVELLLKDDFFIEKYRKQLSIFVADRYTFFALVFSVTKKNRTKAFKYLCKSFLKTPLVLGKRRFWASLKHIFS
jgi:glycosyltransferase involved in cell wall biosynthesis